jgi:hypothetical protein
MHELENVDPEEQLSLAELVNRVLDRGAVIAGEVTISVAGIDLIYVGLQIVVAATETAYQYGERRTRG